jgi:chemotaxis protein methyltransferase CheR
MTMKETPLQTATIKLSTAEFERLSKFIYDHCGINLQIQKKVLVESRLQKRLRAQNISSFKQYWDFLNSPQGMKEELVHMIDVVTTNKTDFFREPQHFEFMKSVALPELHQVIKGRRPLRVWSSACSSGEEPYTLAMVLQDFALLHQGFDYRIMATDISTKVLNDAAIAIYAKTKTADIPLPVMRKYFLKSKDPSNQTVRVVPELRNKVQFKRLNLKDDSWSIDATYDIIFCRNVMIYFDRPSQEAVVNKLIAKLPPGGYFFIGHSESLQGMDLPLKLLRPTMYKKI